MKRKKFFILLFLFLFLNLIADDDLQFISATTGAACLEVEYDNEFLFTGTGSTLRIYYVGENSAPPHEMIFEHRYRSAIFDLQVKDNCLYVAANHDGFSKWDISNPYHPIYLYEILPDSGDATYDITLYDNKIYLAQDSKISVYSDSSDFFSDRIDFGYTEDNGVIHGTAVKNGICAFTVCFGTNDGVYFYDANTYEFIHFYPLSYANPQEVVYGKMNNLLHILGSNTIGHLGYFFSLNINEITAPEIIHADTIQAANINMAIPMNAENINDTLYITTVGGRNQEDPNNGYVYVYDATDSTDVSFLTYIYGGLLHFDVAYQEDRLYIASEWFGVKTMDISNLFSPLDLGDTHTGGWNKDVDIYADQMITAHEGFGFKKYDISSIEQPVLINENNEPGFCHHAKFSADGDYIYGFYTTYDGFRIFDANTLNEISSINSKLANEDGRVYVHGQRIFAGYANVLIPRINIIDVSDPADPDVEQTIYRQNNDMCIDKDKLYITDNNSLDVYDISNGGFELIDSETYSVFCDFKALTVVNDTIFTYISGIGGGLARYIFNEEDNDLVFDQIFSEVDEPDYMAVDFYALYLAYTKKGLYSHDKITLEQTGYYRHGLDVRYPGQASQGVRSLLCKAGYIFPGGIPFANIDFKKFSKYSYRTSNQCSNRDRSLF